MRALGVIPARFGSSRFPGKPLAVLGGRPLVAHVVSRAREAASLDRVVVATDDRRIADAAEAAGAEARMTPADLPSGSDRAAWTAARLAGEGAEFDVVVNVQGDEPFVPGVAIDRAVAALAENSGAKIATLARPLDEGEFLRPDVVKVVLDGRARALYFSRAAIPHPRSRAGFEPLQHVGLYVFRWAYLKRFVKLPVSPLERVEGLEQLRALEDGAKIQVVVGGWPALGIDTPEDLARAERRLARAARGGWQPREENA